MGVRGWPSDHAPPGRGVGVDSPAGDRPTTSGTRPPDRLRRPQDFLAVLREGRRGRHRLLGLAVRCNGLADNRVGYAVGKRVGSAVVRNRVKRRLREILRAEPLIPGHDIVVTAYPEAAGASFDELREAVLACARRSRVLDLDRTEGAGAATGSTEGSS